MFILTIEAELRDTKGIQEILADDSYFDQLTQEATNYWTYKTDDRDDLEDMEETIRATLFRTGLKYEMKKLTKISWDDANISWDKDGITREDKS